MTLLIIIAAVILAAVVLSHDNGPANLPPAPDEDEWTAQEERSRRWVEDYTQAAYAALDKGETEEALRLWRVAGRSAASFEELLKREGRG